MMCPACDGSAVYEVGDGLLTEPYRNPDAERLKEAKREQRAAQEAEKRRLTDEKGRRIGQIALLMLAGGAGALHVALAVGWGSTVYRGGTTALASIAFAVLGVGGLLGILAAMLGATAVALTGPTAKRLATIGFGLIVSLACLVLAVGWNLANVDLA
jgi:hypothetical protein